MAVFDYEGKVWGGVEIKPSPFYIQGLKLKYTLQDLKNVSGRVLDVGCGGGNIARGIKKYRPDLEVYGIDISQKAINVAKSRSGKVTFSVAPSEKIPFPDNYFDMVTMYDVLEHVDDPLLVLKEVRRVLKDSGVFHIFLPLDRQKGTIYELLYKLGWQSKNKFTGHLVAYSDKTASDIYKKGGFKVIKKRFSFHYFFSVFDILYFTYLDISGQKPTSSIEGEIEKRRDNVFFSIFNLFYRCIVAVGYIESLLLKDLPGGGGDYLLIKLLIKEKSIKKNDV